MTFENYEKQKLFGVLHCLSKKYLYKMKLDKNMGPIQSIAQEPLKKLPT